MLGGGRPGIVVRCQEFPQPTLVSAAGLASKCFITHASLATMRLPFYDHTVDFGLKPSVVGSEPLPNAPEARTHHHLIAEAWMPCRGIAWSTHTCRGVGVGGG